jgi:hypothetical protein
MVEEEKDNYFHLSARNAILLSVCQRIREMTKKKNCFLFLLLLLFVHSTTNKMHIVFKERKRRKNMKWKKEWEKNINFL